MNTRALEELGFTKSEINVYLALLELGASSTGPIIEKSKVSSSKIYEILDRLIDKGIVTFVYKGNTKQFEAAPPKRILDYITEKENKLEEQKDEVTKMLPQLELLQTLTENKQSAKIYRGYKGMETAFMSAIEEMKAGQEVLVMDIPTRSERANRFFIRWSMKRKQKGLTAKLMFDERARGETQTRIRNDPKLEIRFYASELEAPVAINVFPEHVLIFPKETEKNPIIIEMRGKAIADSFRNQFYQRWNKLSRSFEGIIGPQQVYREITQSEGEILVFGLNLSKADTLIPEERDLLLKHIDKHKRVDRVIINGPLKNHPIAHHAQVRRLPEEYLSPVQVEIYGDHVGIIDWSEPITTVILDKKEIADAYRKHFELLWKIAKEETSVPE